MVKKIVSKSPQSFDVGLHKISVWAPTYNLLQDSFVVNQDKVTFFTRHLKHTHDYKYFVFKKAARTVGVITPVCLSVLSPLAYYIKLKDRQKELDKLYAEALLAKNKYDYSYTPSEFEDNYIAYYDKLKYYESEKKQFNKLKQQAIAVSSGITLTAITALFLNKLVKKTEFKEEPLLSRIQPTFNPINKQICLVVTLK